MSESVRAKFKVTRIIHVHGLAGAEIVLAPVYPSDAEPENRAFWEATPNGEVRLTIQKPEAAAHFEIGASYYLDFHRAE